MISPEKLLSRSAPMRAAAWAAAEKDIARICPQARLLKGLRVRGTYADSAQGDVEDWLRKTGKQNKFIRRKVNDNLTDAIKDGYFAVSLFYVSLRDAVADLADL
jgi:hypothetical protein